MKLPKGVTHLPNKETLIAKDQDAVLRISTSVGSNAVYKVNDRTFDTAIAPYLKGDWERFCQRFPPAPKPVVYSGAEHRGNPKIPNLTVVPNIAMTKDPPGPVVVPETFLFACTMGHAHMASDTGPRVQEVYEFQSYGLLVIAAADCQPEIWVARDGDKVAVPDSCHMTLYNLGDERSPLITLDFADPDRNKSNKDVEKQFGPILLAWYTRHEVLFTLNESYAGWSDNPMQVKLNRAVPKLEDRTVVIPRSGRLDLGAFLYSQLTGNADTIAAFARLGFRIRKADPECALRPLPGPAPCGPALSFARPLVDTMRPGTRAFSYFFPGAGALAFTNDAAAFVREEQKLYTDRQKRVIARRESGNGPGQLSNAMFLVEGPGEWVEKAYRPVFLKLASEGRRIAVFYADDTRWRPAPAWVSKLEDWETYLDKALSEHVLRHRNLRPDVVIVVTPDFTHSDIARQWVTGGVPLILVEKPFDSLLSNVDRLFEALARHQDPIAIRGLDHYQYRAAPLHGHMKAVADHLRGLPRAIRFFMTEKQPLEHTRLRTLQYGLTLDMLPHLVALLAAFGRIETIDEVEILEAGQYKGRDAHQNADLAEFPNETFSTVRLTFEPFGSAGARIPVTAVVGKGFEEEVKYLEADGTDGNRVRLDFRKGKFANQSYEVGRLLFLHDHPGPLTTTMTDPYAGCPIHVENRAQLLDPKIFYEDLIAGSAQGGGEGLGYTLLPGECWQVVKVLDCIWRAIQDYRRGRGGWDTWEFASRHPLAGFVMGAIDPNACSNAEGGL